MTEWFERWFGEEYLKLYPHRDDRDAEEAIALVERFLTIQGLRILDLACGPGRHAARLQARGARVVGFDLSMPLLSRARHGNPPVDRLVRGDMRVLPFGDASFELVTNLFTSFGYFARDEQHADVIRQVARIVGPGGHFVFDYLNAPQVRASLVPHEERRMESQTVVINRSITDDGQFVQKEMHLVDDGRTFVERVRLFEPDEIERLLADAGFTIRDRFGDYRGSPASPAAPRAIFVGQRP